MPYQLTQQTNRYVFNPADYGFVDPTGVADSSTAIATAMNLANVAGGGCVKLGQGTFISGNQPCYPKVYVDGAGPDATTVKLKNGANTDLFSAQTGSINIGAANGTSGAGTLFNFGLSNLTLDGNKANQTGGPSYPLRYYGYAPYLQNLVIKNGFSGGLQSDWNGGSGTPGADAMEGFVENVKVHDCNGIGFEWGGPHDTHFVNVFSFTNGSHCFHIGPNATGLLWTNAHGYQPPLANSSVVWLIEANSGQYCGFVAEGSDTANLVLLAGDCTFVGVRIYGITGSTPRTSQVGIQLGQAAGGTPYNGSVFQSAGLTTAQQTTGCFIDGSLTLNNGGSVSFVNEANNNINVSTFQGSGSRIIGTPNATTTYKIVPTDALAADGTIGKGGGMVVSLNSPNALAVNNRTSLIFNVQAFSKIVQVSNGTILRLYSDSFTTRVVDIGTNGTISVNQSATAVAIANAGTIASNVGVSRVAPTGNVTGVLLASGSLAGQVLYVVNESAFTITFDIAANSHVSGGVAVSIAAGAKATFVWDSITALWY